MAYDHHRKAGNQGDCVKHPPLIAALDEALRNASNSQCLFHYLDIFAGHAWHPLLDGDEYEWKNGIGKLAPANPPKYAPDCVKSWWGMWHDAPKWPTTTPAGYPGSAWIAANRCRCAKRPVNLELYDCSEEARRDLERAFPPTHAIQDAGASICLIRQSLDPAQEKQEHINQPNFVFIDPPGWQSTDHPQYPRWNDILEHVLKPRGGDGKRPTLLWMPAGGQERTMNKKDPQKENSGAYPWDENSNGDQRRKCDQVTEQGYSWTAVRWQKNSYSACMLVYNCAKVEIRAAVDTIVGIAGNGWEKKHSSPLEPQKSSSSGESRFRNH